MAFTTIKTKPHPQTQRRLAPATPPSFYFFLSSSPSLSLLSLKMGTVNLMADYCWPHTKKVHKAAGQMETDSHWKVIALTLLMLKVVFCPLMRFPLTFVNLFLIKVVYSCKKWELSGNWKNPFTLYRFHVQALLSIQIMIIPFHLPFPIFFSFLSVNINVIL